MNVSLTPELERLIKKKLESGMYSSASEVVREALRTLQAKDVLRETRIRELRRQIQLGFNSGPAEPLDLQGIKQRGRKRLEEKTDNN